MSNPNPFAYPDEAKRCSDAVNLQVALKNFGKWIAVRMSDGGSDGVAYDYRAEAVRHQLHEQLCCYVKVPPTGMSVKQAHNFLRFNRFLYDRGMRIIDPDREIAVAPSLRQETVPWL